MAGYLPPTPRAVSGRAAPNKGGGGLGYQSSRGVGGLVGYWPEDCPTSIFFSAALRAAEKHIASPRVGYRQDDCPSNLDSLTGWCWRLQSRVPCALDAAPSTREQRGSHCGSRHGFGAKANCVRRGASSVVCQKPLIPIAIRNQETGIRSTVWHPADRRNPGGWKQSESATVFRPLPGMFFVRPDPQMLSFRPPRIP